MYLDKRSEQILQEILIKPENTAKRIQLSFNISANQFNYSFNKINDWLEGKNISKMIRMPNGKFLVKSEVFQLLDLVPSMVKMDYIFNDRERGQLILLMLLSKKTEADISMEHFIQMIQVSKNTIVRTIRELRKLLPRHIQLNYSRQCGYELVGNEWELRKLLFSVVSELKALYQGDHLLLHFADIYSEELGRIKHRLENAEIEMGINYTDEQVEILPYLLVLTSRRSKTHEINQSFRINEKMLSDTQEYHIAETILDDWQETPEKEKLFITLQILSTNIFSGEVLTEAVTNNLVKVIAKCLSVFEEKTMSVLKNKEEIAKRLLYHLKPAYYRIKYEMRLDSLHSLEIMSVDPAQMYLIKETFQPFSEFVGKAIPENELMLLSLFIFNEIPESFDFSENKRRAIVLCKGGALVAKLLESRLKSLFPEFDFYSALSIREFSQFSRPIDVIFSTVALTHQSLVFIVNPTMTAVDTQKLRQNVLQSVLNIGGRSLHLKMLENIMRVIGQHAVIENYESLEKGIMTALTSSDYLEELPSERVHPLNHLLLRDHIQIVGRVGNYEEAIRLASQPLLETNKISAGYIEQMIKNHDFSEPYMVLNNKVAIPHASPSSGVKELSMALLIVKEGVAFSKGSKTQIVVVFAPIDKESHLNYLFQVVNLAENLSLVKKLVNCNKEGIHQLLSKVIS